MELNVEVDLINFAFPLQNLVWDRLKAQKLLKQVSAMEEMRFAFKLTALS